MSDMSRRKLYAAGEPLGNCVTRREGGRLVCGGGGGSSKSTTTPVVPDELKPAAQSLSKIATQVGNTPYQAYTGQGVAGLNGQQQQAISMIQDRAANGSPIMDQANSTLTSMLQGGQTNPYLDQMVGNAQKSVVDAYNMVSRPQQIAAGINSGSFGNSGLQQAQAYQDGQLQQQLGNLATTMYGNAYNTDQANKLSALGMAQSYGNQAYTDAGQLLNAGTTAQNNQQDQLDFQYQQFQNQQDYPLKQLQALTGVLGQNMGQKTTQSGGGK